MSYKIRSKENNKLEVEIKISQEKWEESVEKSYEETKGKYSVQGFRKGKAPRKVIENNMAKEFSSIMRWKLLLLMNIMHSSMQI